MPFLGPSALHQPFECWHPDESQSVIYPILLTEESVVVVTLMALGLFHGTCSVLGVELPAFVVKNVPSDTWDGQRVSLCRV